VIRFGFGSATAERFPLCIAGKWEELTKSFLREGKDKGTATRFTNETKLFFEDMGSILWITFIEERLYWGFLEAAPPEPHPDGRGVVRAVKNGWNSSDLAGEPLTKDRLAGSLTKLSMYRGTSCNVDEAKYLIRRLNGEKTPEVERALAASKEMKASILGMMTKLGPQDFETLVDLVFSTSGWRRQGPVGKTQKTLDFSLMLPSTGESAFVQVKSKTSSAELADYVAKLDTLGAYNKMFYVYHSGEAHTTDVRVKVIGPELLKELVFDAGLTNWLINKVL